MEQLSFTFCADPEPAPPAPLPAGARAPQPDAPHTFSRLPAAQRQPARAAWDWILTADDVRHTGELVADGSREVIALWFSTGEGARLAAKFSISASNLAGGPVYRENGYVIDGDGWRLLVRLTAADIAARMDAISTRAAASQAASCVFVTGARGGATMDYMTAEELAAMNYLRMMLPLHGEAALAARERIRARVAARGARAGHASTTQP